MNECKRESVDRCRVAERETRQLMYRGVIDPIQSSHIYRYFLWRKARDVYRENFFITRFPLIFFEYFFKISFKKTFQVKMEFFGVKIK